MTKKQLFNKIKRRYKYVTPYKFAYNSKEQLRRKLSRIKSYLLCYDPEVGYVIYDFDWTSAKNPRTPKQWSAHLKKVLLPAFAKQILPAINAKKNRNRRFVELILYHATRK